LLFCRFELTMRKSSDSFLMGRGHERSWDSQAIAGHGNKMLSLLWVFYVCITMPVFILMLMERKLNHEALDRPVRDPNLVPSVVHLFGPVKRLWGVRWWSAMKEAVGYLIRTQAGSSFCGVRFHVDRWRGSREAVQKNN
jgi:hypothetical protein